MKTTAELLAEEYRKNHCEPITDDGRAYIDARIEAYLAGYSKASEIAEIQFDEVTAELDSDGYQHDVFTADPDGVSSCPAKHWVDGRRFQFEQDRLAIEKLNRSLESAIEHLKKAQNIIVEDECEECGTFKGVRYEIKPITDFLAKLKKELGRE